MAIGLDLRTLTCRETVDFPLDPQTVELLQTGQQQQSGAFLVQASQDDLAFRLMEQFGVEITWPLFEPLFKRSRDPTPSLS